MKDNSDWTVSHDDEDVLVVFVHETGAKVHLKLDRTSAEKLASSIFHHSELIGK